MLFVPAVPFFPLKACPQILDTNKVKRLVGRTAAQMI